VVNGKAERPWTLPLSFEMEIPHCHSKETTCLHNKDTFVADFQGSPNRLQDILHVRTWNNKVMDKKGFL